VHENAWSLLLSLGTDSGFSSHRVLFRIPDKEIAIQALDLG